MAATDDLSSILSRPEPGRIEYGQGVLTAWDPDTFENTIRWQEVPLSNAIIAPGVDALSLQPGDPVLLMILKPPEGGTPSFVVLGRMSVPPLDNPVAIRGGTFSVEGGGDISVTDGSLVAADSEGDVFRVDPTVPEIFMRQSLISDLARQIMADTLTSESVGPGVTTGSTSYTALSGGPVVAAEVSDAGRMLVTIGANISPGSWDSGDEIVSLAYLGFDVSGASSVSADDLRSLHVGSTVSSDQPITKARFAATRQVMLEGLNAGSHVVAARYRVDVSGSGTINNATFSGRSITVQAF